MAMRGRGVINRDRPKTIVGRVYEQFSPMSEWRREDDHHTLLVYLPGFQKEYIKVTTENLNILRVRGERLVAGNKWSRFQQDFQVPENCEMRGIRAKFDAGILTIIMPRKNTMAPPPATVAPPPATVAPPPVTTTATTTTTTTTQVIPKVDQEQPIRTKRQEEAPTKPKEESTKQDPLKRDLEAIQEPITPEPTSSSSARPVTQETLKGRSEKEITDGKVEKPNDDKGVIAHTGIIGNTSLDQGTEKESVSKTTKDLNETSGDLGRDKVEEYKKVVKGLAKGAMNEERELLVNMGVAVLVIVGLVAYVSYTIGRAI